jgi:hypothetical protein
MDRRRWPAIMVILALVMLFPTASCQPPDNYAPVINSLEADAEWTLPSSSVNVTCNASDRDGDELSYGWSATGGNITGAGPVAIWTAPEEVGVYTLTVVADDGQGGNDTESITLIVATGTLPMIENLIVTADHKYLKETTTGYKVGKGQQYHIACNVSSNVSEELTYEWLCTGGEFSGGGSNITWTAPNTSGVVTVTAIVFDLAGNMDKDDLLLTVVSCSVCEFG